MRKLLTIEGMSCGHCVMHVRSALEEVPGVTSVEVDLLKKSAMVEGEALNDGVLNAAVVGAGYHITAVSGNR
jgi:copper chaperone CopZ